MRRSTFPAVVIATLLLGGLLTLVSARPVHTQGATTPDLIFVNARIYTVDRTFSTAEALAITGGKFAALGSNGEIRRLAGPSTKVIDVHGQTIIPGLQDDHLHNAGGGPGVDLSRARSLSEVLSLIAARVRISGPNDVVITNSDWHEAQLNEQRLPYRTDLDTVAPSTPVVVVRGGHEYILNSAALRKYGIEKQTPEPPGGRISRDEHGELNGELMDRAKALVTLPRESSERPSIDYFIAEHKKLNAAGLTAIRYPGAGIDQYRILQEMERKGLLTIRVNQLMRAFDATDVTTMKAALVSWNVKQGEGDDWLRIG
ncbi:MAG TPA: amidohydrolase family protein, partial [Vicinamibacterales bacterium]|nr:amidohydrolase family protein [Vicinamibacterales bacterium]